MGVHLPQLLVQCLAGEVIWICCQVIAYQGLQQSSAGIRPPSTGRNRLPDQLPPVPSANQGQARYQAQNDRVPTEKGQLSTVTNTCTNDTAIIDTHNIARMDTKYVILAILVQGNTYVASIANPMHSSYGKQALYSEVP
jgi:hypothetical protein